MWSYTTSVLSAVSRRNRRLAERTRSPDHFLRAEQWNKLEIHPKTRNRIFTRVLDNLSTKKGSKEGREAIDQGLDRLFGMNVVGAKQASDGIQRWLNRPRIITEV